MYDLPVSNFILQDVPHFVHWLKHLKTAKESAAKTETPATTETAAAPAAEPKPEAVTGTANGNGVHAPSETVAATA